jgi:arylsulfatase A-like enzyme
MKKNRGDSEYPNLVFVFADQMRGMSMGCAGDPNVLTPNMDKMAEEGVRFSHAYANNPVCTPSRACMLTGRHSISNRTVTNDLPMPENEITFGEILKQAGYRTGYVGKWHLDGIPRSKFTPPGACRHGFDYWAVWNCSHDYFNGKVYCDTPEPVQLSGYEPEAQTDLALKFLHENADEPLCLFLSWGPPHDPYHQVPEKYRQLYDPERLELPPNVPETPDFSQAPLGRMDSESGMRRTIADYYAAITALDEQLGRILSTIDELNIAENTIVVFTSDHGDMLFSQGSFKKQQPYEESINIPLITRWNGKIPKGIVSDTLFSTVDFLPTLLSAMNIEQPKDVEGIDLSYALRGEKGKDPDSVFLMDLVPMDEGIRLGISEWRGVRTKRHTYARWIDGRDWVLFDNDLDPYQLKNLIDDPDAISIKQAMEVELQKQMDQIGDKGLDWQNLLKTLGLVDLWNLREKEMHPNDPRIIRKE